MVSILVIIFLVIIAVFLYVRFSVHFNTCRKVSKKHPGEKIEGCPAWTLVEKDYQSDTSENVKCEENTEVETEEKGEGK